MFQLCEHVTLRVCVLISENSLTKHYLDGHIPYNTDCPWCVQAAMRHRKAIAHSDRLNNIGFSISVDLTGPHEPAVDRNTFALVGVEIASSFFFNLRTF